MYDRQNDAGLQWWQQLGQWALLTQLEREDVKIEELMPSKYLKTSDVHGEQVVTIQELKKANVARDDKPAEYKYTIKFEEFDKFMVLNKTNIKRIGKYVSEDTDDWIGAKVSLYVDDEVQFGDDIVAGLRIRGAANKAPPRQSSSNIDEGNRKARDVEDDSVPF